MKGRVKIKERFDSGGSIDSTRLVHISGNRLQTGKYQKRHKWNGLPDVNGDYNRDGCLWNREPCDFFRDDVEIRQQEIHDPINIIEHPFPDLRRDDRGNGPGDQNGNTEKGPALEFRVCHQRHDQTENRLQRDREEGEYQRIPNCAPPVRSERTNA